MYRRFQGPRTGAIVGVTALIQVVGTLFAASRQDAVRPLDALAFLLLLAGPASLAFRKKALEHHPDRGGAPEQFMAIKRAYDALVKRRTRAKRTR